MGESGGTDKSVNSGQKKTKKQTKANSIKKGSFSRQKDKWGQTKIPRKTLIGTASGDGRKPHGVRLKE